ncbi:MAG TPA: OmpA family protein [Acetobacteraceae bacterium]|nr:OmpA family protein [Acetobacteraceae bacterium]
MRSFIAPLILAPLVFATAPAFAQNNPSAEQIINSLKPTGNLTAGGTRGIRLAAPPPGMTTPYAAMPAVPGQRRVAAAKPMAPATMQAQAGGPSVNLTVNFANGSADLTPEAMATLDQLGRALSSSDLASYRFRIEGHTDTVGSAEYNRVLSERRAEAVVNYIVTKFGVPASRLQAVGMGEQGLLVSTPDQTPEPRNRRVQVVNLGA